MILVCEMIFDSGSHIPFNAGLLATIRAAFPKEEIAFYGSTGHLIDLKKQVGQTAASAIQWNEIQPIPPGPGYGKRFISEFRLIRRLFSKLHHSSTSRLLLTSAFPSTVLAVKIARLFGLKCSVIQIVLHKMSGVVGRRYRRPILRLRDMKTALSLLGNSGIQYLVLEEFIRHAVVKSIPQLDGKIETLEHPIAPTEGGSKAVDLSNPIHFGFLGNTLKSKGYPLFVQVANVITARYGRHAEFHVIGRCLDVCERVNGEEVLASKPAAAKLTRDEFVCAISALHYVILPHETEAYTLTASGVLLDAIAWQKPVIARKIHMFEALFEKYGDIGYLFRDEADLISIIEQILQTTDASRYRRQTITLGDVRKSRDPETLAAAYRNLCRASEGKS